MGPRALLIASRRPLLRVRQGLRCRRAPGSQGAPQQTAPTSCTSRTQAPRKTSSAENEIDHVTACSSTGAMACLSMRRSCSVVPRRTTPCLLEGRKCSMGAGLGTVSQNQEPRSPGSAFPDRSRPLRSHLLRTSPGPFPEFQMPPTSTGRRAPGFGMPNAFQAPGSKSSSAIVQTTKALW